MCYICSCFSWSLDVIQRAITFALACCFCCMVVVGLGVAIAAGIAYGYNYSLAEFVTLSKSDLTVYMRRGQFYDETDPRGFLNPESRRAVGGPVAETNVAGFEDNAEVARIGSSDTKPLSETWAKAAEAKNYADRLAKYSTTTMITPRVWTTGRPIEHFSEITVELTTEDSVRTSFSSIQLVPSPFAKLNQAATPIVRDSSSILLRKFMPADNSGRLIDEENKYKSPYRLVTERVRATIPVTMHNLKNMNSNEDTEEEISKGQRPKKIRGNIPRGWTAVDSFHEVREKAEADNLLEEQYDDNILYKPV